MHFISDCGSKWPAQNQNSPLAEAIDKVGHACPPDDLPLLGKQQEMSVLAQVADAWHSE